jgi:hypothetical protein
MPLGNPAATTLLLSRSMDPGMELANLEPIDFGQQASSLLLLYYFMAASAAAANKK